MIRGWLFSLVTAVCGAAAFADAPAPPPMLPTPYSAEQIRAVWQPGFRVEMRTREAGVLTRQRMTVLSATAETATIRSEQFGANGELREPAREAAAKWEELRDHALFPAARATRDRAECRSQLGSAPGWRYVVALANDETLTLCFGDATPGPPVEFETRRGGALVSRTEHVRYERAASRAEGKL